MAKVKAYVRGNETYYPFAYPVQMWTGKWAKKRPDNFALVDLDRGKIYTYKELHIRSNILANSLLVKGLKKGDVVSVILGNCVEFMEIYFACAKIGVIFTPLNYRLTPRELKYQVDFTEPALVIVGEEFAHNVVSLINSGINLAKEHVYCLRLPQSEDSLPFQDYEVLLRGSNSEDPKFDWNIDMEDIQVIMFTSGTTGRAKACMLSYRKTFYNTINDVMDDYYTPFSKILLSVPLYHSHGLNIIAVPILYIGGIIVMKRGGIEELLETIEKEQINAWSGIAVFGRMMLMVPEVEKKYKLECLQSLQLGGEPVPGHLVKTLQQKWPHIVIASLFGTTETSQALALPFQDAVRKAGSAGKAMFYDDIRVVDENNNDVRPGEIGELLIGGPIVFSGYWKDPEATKEAINEEGYFHTGDLVRMDEEGYIYVVEREKDVVISGGENIYPAEVEEIISQHPKVKEVAVIGVPDERWGERPIAIIVSQGGQAVNIEEIRQFCQDKLAKFKIPDRIELADSIPYSGSLKVARWQLKAKYGGGIAK